MPRLSTVLLLIVTVVSSLGLAATPGCQNKDAREAPPPGSPDPGPPVDRSGWVTYTQPDLGFRVGHPQNFVVRRQDVAKLPRFDPAPAASLFFMNPTMAAGGLAGVEPPDLEVRVYPAGTAESVENWLLEARFATAETVKAARPFHKDGVAGLQVCASTMIAPGCSVYVLRGDRAYQLTAASREGEAMIETFELTPRP
jgi:hypothetical protein